MKRTLSAINLVTLGIGAIIGAGFFVLTGHAAAENAGPAVTLSFVVGGIACAFAGLCYAEMASTVPIAGSAYTYAYATMGEFIAWLIGWDLILEYMVGATTVAIGWSGYVTSVLRDFGIHIPAQFTSSPGTKLVEVPNAIADQLHMRHGWTVLNDDVLKLFTNNHIAYDTFTQVTAIINVPAMFIVALVTALLVIGIKESASVNDVIVLIKVAIVVMFIIVGLPMVSIGQLGRQVHPGEHRVVPLRLERHLPRGRPGLLRLYRLRRGLDGRAGGEEPPARHADRHHRLAVICTILYCLGAIVMTGVVNYKQLDVPDPVAVAIDAMGLTWLSGIVKLGAIAGLSSVILVMLLSQPRIFYSMARDGLLPRPSPRSTRGSARPGSRRSSPA